MAPFVHSVDVKNVGHIVTHFQNIPDITEYILECDRYPLAALDEALETLYKSIDQIAPENQEIEEYRQTVTKIENLISTRIDYVSSFIDHLLGKGTFDTHTLSLENSPTDEILFHIDLLQDVAHSSDINREHYEVALRKFVRTLKFRFNKGLEIHKQFHHLEFEDIAEQPEEFPPAMLEEYRGFLEDALAMTRTHVPVTLVQIHQLKETLFKILEATGVRMLQSRRFQVREEYAAILKEIEDVLIGLEVDVAQKVLKRFTDVLPEYIADHWNFHVIKHNRKLTELLIDLVDDATLVQDLYQMLIDLTTAEATQIAKKQELSIVTFENIKDIHYVEDEENAVYLQMEKFKKLTITEKARELIKLSLYGLCEYVSKLSVEEFRKYPIGILKSAEKMLKDLEQHRLRRSDVRMLRNVPEYTNALGTVAEALATYESSIEKYNFVDVYKETDFTTAGVAYCMFNDIVLRVIQNVTEAYFVVDTDDNKFSESRLAEFDVTLAERYKTEWMRQNAIRQQIDQEAMEALAQELV